MAKDTKKQVITVEPVKVNHVVVSIAGDGDLVLNRMNASNTRQLIAEDRKTAALWEAQHQNKWENVITSMHWRDGIPVENTNEECSEELLHEMFQNNAPCISAFGLKKSWGQAVVRNEIDTYATKFDNAVNIVASGGLVPIKFAKWSLDEKLMSPKRGAPLSVMLNRFSGWSADITIGFTEHVYTLNEIVNIINYAGFGIGIGSGRTSGYGRYHVTDVK